MLEHISFIQSVGLVDTMILKIFFIFTDRKVILILLAVAIGVMVLGMIIITVAICCVFQR